MLVIFINIIYCIYYIVHNIKIYCTYYYYYYYYYYLLIHIKQFQVRAW
jgi:hypothetical protein